jgi:succinate-semialdehyde dehydrogenase/glutarate-semialdehyde dehydrogenase
MDPVRCYMTTSKRRILPVYNPRTGQIDYQITPPTPEETAGICGKLRQAQKSWDDKSLEYRISVMKKWANRIAAHRELLAERDSIDTGYCSISRMSPDIVINNINNWCARAPETLKRARLQGKISFMPNISFDTNLRPYPLLGVISPWNAPMMLSLIDAVPALFAGCAVIIKPSEVTPRFVEPMMQTVQEVPELAEVLTYVVGDGETGQDIIKNVDIVVFTGSVPNGLKVAESCARRFIPAYLELGGKDPVIVTETADIERAATAVLRGACFGTGQVCFSIERIYVQEKVHDSFLDILIEKAERVELNYPDINKGQIGPFGTARQAQIVDEHLDDAVKKGAKIRTGGKSMNLGGGLYMRPTVLTDVDHDMKIMREETFGPVMPVARYATVEDAVHLANDTIYGLSAAVIAGSELEAKRIADRIEAGTICIQDTFLTLFKTFDVESNAFKFSGMGGCRTGPGSIMRFFRKQSFLTNTADPIPFA